MGKVKNQAVPGPLVLHLDEPGMTAMLRAGLGGLAASLLAISRSMPGHDWPKRVGIGAGYASVESRQITIHWGEEAPEATLKALFAQSFKIQDDLICLPGMFGPGRQWSVTLGSVLQSALKLTFLQHGKSTKKAGAPIAKTVQPDDDVFVEVSLQPYSGFAHQEAWADAIASFESGVQLAGWANPGAVGRHNAYGNTELTYTPSQTLAAVFCIVGCLSFQVTGDAGMGALIVPIPANLIEFANARSAMTPAARDVYVAGTSDAVLSASLALKAARINGLAIEAMEGVTLRATAWASQQKSRVSTVQLHDINDARFTEILVTYEAARKSLPTRIIVRKPPEKKRDAKKNKESQEPLGYFAAASALRGFIAENLAAGKTWFQGFATAKVGLKRPRYLNQFRQQDNLGALLPGEKKGLWTMIDTTQEPDKILILSIHTALRQRFGAIGEETKNLPLQTRKNRWNGERERWRLAFAKAKTADQTRAALADLWSRAGANKELREHWQEVLPLLKADEWMRARDLALVALASYRGKNEEDDNNNQDDVSADDGL